jgi:hypothetical protein
VPLFFASLALCGVAVIMSIVRIARGRGATTLASTAVNAYAAVVALCLALPYADWT